MNSEKLTCIEGLSLSLTSKRTPRTPKRIGTLTIKPAKRVDSFSFICRWVFVVGVVRRLASPEVFRALPRLRPAHIRSQANGNGLFTVWELHPRELSLLLPVSSMSKNSSVSVALLLLLLYTAKIQKLSEYTIGVQKYSLPYWIIL